MPEPLVVVAIACAFLVAGFVKGVTGLGLPTVVLALLTALLDLKTAMALLIVYSLVNLAGWRFDLARSQERWAGPLAGAINGVLTGMTGSFAVPGVMYLQGIGLGRDMLIQAMGMLFTASTVALAFALADNRMLSADLAAMSACATVPAILGMMLGQRIRKAMPEALFRRVFFVALLILGGYIAARAIGRLA